MADFIPLTQLEQQYLANTTKISDKIKQLGEFPPSERVKKSDEIRKLLSNVKLLLDQIKLKIEEYDAFR